ncbi:hypothetical protein CSOJ01_05397 [Colletotrichum sojae]|uniref:Uncharacterized protein n=1 Tax=Colletotrichum sojae TaxID=2175907 RepID=A0A8H6JF05_9PEZI|nr:hypothetical protein CSOJ01_05397 [Colletotrichum sojae]
MLSDPPHLARQTSASDDMSSEQHHDIGQRHIDEGGHDDDDDDDDDERHKPISPIEGITDASISADFTHLYGWGQKLHLTHHKPCNPYGTAHYLIPPGVNIDDLSYTFETAQVPRTQAVFNYKPTPYKPNPPEDDEGS